MFPDDIASLFNLLTIMIKDLQFGSMDSMLGLLSFKYSDSAEAIPTKSAPRDLTYSFISFSIDKTTTSEIVKNVVNKSMHSY